MENRIISDLKKQYRISGQVPQKTTNGVKHRQTLTDDARRQRDLSDLRLPSIGTARAVIPHTARSVAPIGSTFKFAINLIELGSAEA